MPAQNFGLPVPIPSDSVLVYRPDRRLQVWRFFSYMFLHANWFHLGFNIVIQLFFGIPLEVMHGTARIGVIYMAGVFAGSLGTSVVDSEVFLVGASGGVYALLAAHLANITLNYAHMKSASTQLGSVVIFGEFLFFLVSKKQIELSFHSFTWFIYFIPSVLNANSPVNPIPFELNANSSVHFLLLSLITFLMTCN